MSKIEEYLEGFINRSKATERLHRKVLAQYNRFVDGDEQLYTVHTAQRFLADCKKRGMENVSVSTYTSVLRSFLKFLDVPDKELNVIRAPQVGFKIKHAIDEDNWVSFLKQPRTLQDMAIAHVLLYGACRVGEIRRIKVRDINFESKTIVIGGTRDAKVGGSIQLNNDTLEVIQAYIKAYKLMKSDYLLRNSRENMPLSERSIETRVKKWAIAAGVPNAEKITPHSLRRSLGKAFYQRSGKDIEKTRIMLRHQNISSTQHYLSIQEEEVRNDYRKMFD
jgi:site-specific recombinase XerC